MDKQKNYNIPDDSSVSVASESIDAYNTAISPLDALWALVLEQAEDVQRGLELRLRHLLSRKDEIPKPYTVEELHERVTLSEEQFSKGQYFSNAEVQDKVNKLFESWS